MANIPNDQVTQYLRDTIFETLKAECEWFKGRFVKVNDRCYGILMTDMNGHRRYVRLQAVVAEERDTMDAEEYMAEEMNKYQEACDRRETNRLKALQKAESDKRKREKKAEDKAKKEAEKSAS